MKTVLYSVYGQCRTSRTDPAQLTRCWQLVTTQSIYLGYRCLFVSCGSSQTYLIATFVSSVITPSIPATSYREEGQNHTACFVIYLWPLGACVIIVTGIVDCNDSARLVYDYYSSTVGNKSVRPLNELGVFDDNIMSHVEGTVSTTTI